MIFVRCIICTISIFILASCSAAEQIIGKPWHHTTEGFRNPPGSPKKNKWLSRVPWLIGRPFKALFGDKPITPEDHVLKKARVIEGIEDTVGNNTGLDIFQLGIMNPFGRKQETEADYLGLIFSSLSGYDIRESVKLWQRMSEKNKGKEPPVFLSTHPSSKK